MIVAQWYWLENELFQNCSSMLKKAQLLFISPRARSRATDLPGVAAIRDSKDLDCPKAARISCRVASLGAWPQVG
jgi:hypothetical protein